MNTKIFKVDLSPIEDCTIIYDVCPNCHNIINITDYEDYQNNHSIEVSEICNVCGTELRYRKIEIN